MNTTDTIAQLMQVEALPQQALKSKVSVQTKVVSAYQSINTRLSSVASAAKALGGVEAWGAMKATSNSDAAVVTAQPGATSGSLSFRVEQLAATHLMTYTGASVASASNDPVMSGTTIDITLKDGTTRNLTPDGNNLQAVVAAINKDADALYKASAVQIGPGQFTLQLSAKQSGQTAAFTDGSLPTGLALGAATTTVQGTDARLKVGDTA
ncbi:MAG TPA: flagellar cap protein FliD N-terminal domain-containing protein, partial [Actinoplanes sp.]